MAKYIDVDKLVEHIKDLPTWREVLGVGWRPTKYPNGMFDCEDIINSIKNQPAADVEEVKHGEWIPVQYTYFGLKRYECSECKDDEYWQKRYLEHDEKYCPNCGAKMDERRDT